MKLFLDILLVITSLLLIALVLLHRGKGGGLTVFTALIWLISIVGIGLEIKFA